MNHSIHFEIVLRSEMPLQGPTLEGDIVASVTEPCTCKQLTISVAWSRPADKSPPISPPQTLFRGDWTPGTYHYPFVVDVPSSLRHFYDDNTSPAPFGWTLTAEAVLDDDSCVKHLHTCHPPGHSDVPNNSINPPHTQVFADPLLSKIGFKPIIFSFLGFVWFMGFVVLMWAFEGSIPLAIFLLFFPGIVTFYYAKQHFVKRRFGSPTLIVSPSNAGPGEEVEVALQLQALKEIEIRFVKLYLLCSKRFDKTVPISDDMADVSKTRTAYRMLYRSSKSLPLERHTLPEGYTMKLREKFEIPKDAPLSGDAVVWSVLAHVKLESWPSDWEGERVLTVRPHPAPAFKADVGALHLSNR